MSEKTRQELDPHSDNQSSSLGDVPLKALDLFTRAYNCLRRAGLYSAAEVAVLTDEQILNIRGLGITALNEIREKLAPFDLESSAAPVISDSIPPMCVELVNDDTPIEALQLSRRLNKSLCDADIRTVGAVAKLTTDEVLSLHHIEQRSLNKIRYSLLEYRDRPLPCWEVLENDDTSISTLDLSTHPYNALRRAGVTTVGRLAQMSPEQILSVRNVGGKSLAEIEEKLEAYLIKQPLLLPEPPALTVPEPSSPLVDPTLLVHAAQVERYSTWLGEQGKANWSASPVPVLLRNASIKVLDLSIRVHNALMFNGVTTIGQLVQTSSKQILDIRNIGGKSLTEIKKKLEAYLGKHPLLPPEPTLPVELEPPVPLVDPLLLDRAAQVPLGDISVERLALPVHWRNQLHRLGIESVGELTQQTVDAFGQDPLVENQLERYLTWLVEQDEAIWADEVAGRGISPLHRLAIAEATMEDMVERWLDVLQPQKPWASAKSTNRNRDRQVICWRYGLDGELLTLEEVGERLDVTRSLVGQLQTRALSVLSRSHSRAVIRPLMELLIYLLEQAGGLMNKAQVKAALRQELVVGDIDPIGVVHLVFEINDDVKRLRGAKAWGLKSAPLDELRGVQKWLARVLEEEHVPLPMDETVARFKTTRFYHNRQDILQDSFIVACLRVHPDILVDKDNLCGLERWERHRTDEIILALRKIGDSEHYAVIAEKTNALLEPEMRTSAHNIHAILGRRTDLFVRVGHGVFGLKEWELPDDGSVANAAYRVLSEAGKPLHIETITDRVLETWRVQPTSVSATVELDDRFIKIGHGVYWLREWVIDEVETEKIADFGDLFGARLERWQKDWDHRQGNVELDTQAEVDTIRRIGLDFFND